MVMVADTQGLRDGDRGPGAGVLSRDTGGVQATGVSSFLETEPWVRWTSKAEAFGLNHKDSKDEADRASLARPQDPWKAGPRLEVRHQHQPLTAQFQVSLHSELTRAWRLVSEPTASVFIEHQRVSEGPLDC